MRASIFIVFFAVPLAVWAQGSAKETPRSQDALTTYDSSDGSFQFFYSPLLIHCQLKPQESGEGYYWAQPECSSYHPVCDDAVDPNQSVVCFAYPHDRHTESPTFEAATFSVSKIRESQKDCLGELEHNRIFRIRDTAFRVVESSDAGMSQSRQTTSYVAFHNGACYALAITVATASSGAFDPPVKELTKQDWAEIYHQLDQARDSFRFLK